MELILFYLFGGLAVVSSLFVVAQRNPMYSVLLLIVSFGALAGLYIQLDAPFAAVTQIIIYAGAIMVLFLFVVMLLNVGREEAGPRIPGGARALGTLLAIGLAIELVWAMAVMGGDAPDLDGVAGVSSVQVIGRELFTTHALAFEVTSILILVAMVGAVVLARKEE